MSAVKEIISAQEVLIDWLGAGGAPVNPILAEMRAQRCAIGNNGEPCPHNKHRGWWDTAKHITADWIRKGIELKTGMQLHVSCEDKLGMCTCCGCALPLKCHVPREHLLKHLNQDQFKDAPPYCWIKRELIDS